MSTKQKKKEDVKSDYVIMLVVIGFASLVVSGYQLIDVILLPTATKSVIFSHSLYYFLLAVGIFIAAGLLKVGKRSVIYLLSLLAIIDLIFDLFIGSEPNPIILLITFMFIGKMVTLARDGELS